MIRLACSLLIVSALAACGAPQAPCPCRDAPPARVASTTTCAPPGISATGPTTTVDPASTSTSTPPSSALFSGAVDYEAMSNHVTAALYRSKDGDGAGCLRELDAADAADPRHASTRWMTRSICEFQAGKCVEARARFRKGLDDAPTQRRMKPEELDTATMSMAAQHCPAVKLLPRERFFHDMTALHDASEAKDGAFCAREGLDLIHLIDAAPRGNAADDQARNIAVSDLHMAAECAAKNGHCNEGRAMMHGWWSRLATPASLTPAQIDASFERDHPGCK